MQNIGPRKVAELCAAIRASHFLHGDRPLILEDPFAIELISQELRERCLGKNEYGRSGGASIVLGRARYTDDLLEAAVHSGVDQYVILGAGLDTFALRRPDLVGKVRVYEIDHPATQAWKRDLLAQLDRELPSTLEFIPVDLEHETVSAALGRSSFRSNSRAFFSWLGTLPYLTHEAIIRTLESLAASSAAGSEIAFDYRVSMEFVDPQDVPSVQAGDKATAAAGEVKRSFLNPQTFMDEVRAIGFDVVESLTPKQLAERYFAGRSDAARPTSHQYYAHLRSSGAK
jgi:methyltransferase (TIGR00027 family)